MIRLGNCHPIYGYQHHAGTRNFRSVSESADGEFVLGNALFSMSGGGVYDIDVEERKLILYRPGPGGYVIPYFVDLKRKRPIEECLLNGDEVDALRSDVYNTYVTQGVVSYIQHFEERQVILKDLPGQKIGPKGLLLRDLHEKLNLRHSNSQKIKTFEGLLEQIQEDLFPEALRIIQSHPDALSAREAEMIARFFASPFLRYVIKKSPINLFASRIRPTKADILRTADDRFDMPIYYTLPEVPNVHGWFIVDVHGGPHVREFNELDIIQQFWTSRGLPYIRINIRGSTGLGADYCEASDGNWWITVDDIGPAIEWVRRKGFGKHPIVTGGSFGGYAAAAAYAKGYTKHAIATNGLYDLERDLVKIKEGETKYSKDDLSDPRVQFGGNPAIRLANSVTTHLKHSDGEMLIIAGLKDDNCLPEQSQILFDKMDALGNI